MKRAIIAVLGIVVLCIGGCGTVAITKANVSLRGPYTYEKQTGMYVITRVYKLPSDPEAAMVTGNGEEASDLIPATFEITHIDGETTVTMVEVSRSCTGASTAAGGHLTDVTVTYEGHVPGVVYGTFDSTGSTEPILVDLITKKGIGPNLEGTNRIVPSAVMTVVQNVKYQDIVSSFLNISILTGTINEPAWEDPVLEVLWDEGVWLYEGASVICNRDGTYTENHRFRYNSDTHSFAWRGYTESTEEKVINGQTVEQPVRVYDDEETQSTIYTAAEIAPERGFHSLFE